MTDDGDVSGKTAWGQAVAAVALVGALGVGVWAAEGDSSGESEPKPAACSGGKAEKGERGVSGAQLCKALNRKDLAELLGTPGEIAKTASGSGSTLELAGGREIHTPSAEVQFESYTVHLSATNDGLPVAGSGTLLGDTEKQRKFMGRPAVLYSDRTLAIRFRLDGSDADSGPGVPARVLSVAQDANDRGGSFELTLWREDGEVPDATMLFQVAAQVLPTIPGWAAATR